MMQRSWRKLTHELRGTYLVPSHLSYLVRYLLSAFTCDVTDTFLLLFQMFNRGTHKRNEAPEKVHHRCGSCVSNPITTSTYLKSLFRLIAHIFFFLLFFMIYVKRLHFGQAHGGLRFSSNANCSLWLSAHNVILSPTLCVWR